MTRLSIILLACGWIIPLLLLRLRGLRRRGWILQSIVQMVSLGLLGFGAVRLIAAVGLVAGLAVYLGGFAWIGFLWAVAGRLDLAAATAGSPAPAIEPNGDSVDSGGNGMNGLEEHGEEILSRLLALRNLKIGEIATPRDQVVFADCADGMEAAIERIRQSRQLRIPMVDGSLDRVVGIIHVKDVAPLVLGGGTARPLKALMRRPLFVSKDQTTAALLELFRAQRGHLAVVVDEFNHTWGIATREDLFYHLSGGEQEEEE